MKSSRRLTTSLFVCLGLVSLHCKGAGGDGEGQGGGGGQVAGAPGGGASGDEGGAPGQPGGGGGAVEAGGSGGAGGTLPGQGGGGEGGSTPAQPFACGAAPKLKLTKVATAQNPIFLAQPPGDARLFVAEREGRIRILGNDGQFLSTPFIDFRPSVAPLETERGLQSIAFHPDYANNGRFYVFYTRRSSDPFSQGDHGAIVIAEGKRMSADRAENKLTPLVVQKHDVRYHNGGFMAFGKDGLLYAAIGEGGLDGHAAWGRRAENDPDQMQRAGASTKLDSYIGKLLRIDVDKPGMKLPGNEAGNLPYIYAVGLRNPFRGSFDRQTGDMWIADVGEQSWEEIHYVPAGTSPKHFGWGFMEGSHCFPWFMPVACEPVGLMPIYEYFHDGNGVVTDPKSYMMQGRACMGDFDADCARAVIGGYVYRGTKVKGLEGRYLWGDNVKNWVKSFKVNAEGKADCEVDFTKELGTNATPIRGLAGFGEDSSGELYLFDLFGNVYRIDAA